MASKYAKQFEQYEASTQPMNFNGKALNFVSLSKKNPKTYIQLLSEKLLPVPMHNFVPTTDGKKAMFVCRKFVQQPCFICDSHMVDSYGNEMKPKKTYLGLILEYEAVGPRKYKPVLVDMTVPKDVAKAATDKFGDILAPIEDGDNVKFTDMPKVGMYLGNRGVDADIAVDIAEFGEVNDIVYAISRTGEGLKTEYHARNVGDAPLASDSDEVKASMLLHMDIDTFIDTYIDANRYTRLLGAPGDKNAEHDEAPADPWADTVSEGSDEAKTNAEAEEHTEDAEYSDEDIEEIIRKKFHGASDK